MLLPNFAYLHPVIIGTERELPNHVSRLHTQHLVCQGAGWSMGSSFPVNHGS